MRDLASLLLVLSIALSAIFAPGTRTMQFGQPTGEAPQVRAAEALRAGAAEPVSEFRAMRRCSSQKAFSPSSPACQIDKSLGGIFALAAQAESTAYDPKMAAPLGGRGPAPDHGPPRYPS